MRNEAISGTMPMGSSIYIREAIEHFRLSVSGMQSVEGSHSSTVRILCLDSGEKLVLKIPFSHTKMLREMRILQRLHGELPVPKVVDYWVRDDDSPGVLLLSWLPGKPMTGTVTPELSLKLGELLAQLHTHKVLSFGDELHDPELLSHDWWQYLDNILQTWVPVCRTVMPTALFDRTLKRYDELRMDLPEPDGPCVIHCDYRPGNILAEGGEITGLIDFESTRGGSADLDFVKIKGYVWDISPGTKDTFLTGYASVRELPDIERTMPLYELRNAFGGVAWCARRGRTGDPFFHENMARLQQLL